MFLFKNVGKLVFLIFVLYGFTVIFPEKIYGYPIDPQYILVRKSGGYGTIAGGPNDDSYIWNGAWPDRYNVNAVKEITKAINGTDKGPVGTDFRRLGIGTLFFYNEYSEDWIISQMQQSLTNLLSVSEQTDMPVFIVLDGFSWTLGSPEIWNWWDSSGVGYNPGLTSAVEWYCWEPACATKNHWRGWGSYTEVKSPPPNIMSNDFINTCKRKLDSLLPIIINWYQNLPTEKKYLFAGLSLFMELNISSEYYIGGLLPTDPNLRGFFYSDQVGYNAVRTAGIKSSGTLTDADITNVTKMHITEMYKYAYEKGIPRNKLYDHTGMWGFQPADQKPSDKAFATSDASISEYALPGWSLYNVFTEYPENVTNLTSSLNQLNNTPWALPEWSPGSGHWLNSLRKSINYRNNKMINIANWEGIFTNTEALSAIKKVVYEQPVCYVEAPVLNSPAVNGNSVTFSWTLGASSGNIQELWLYVSDSPDMTIQGSLKNPNKAQDNVSGMTSFTREISGTGVMYYQLIATGCDGSLRKVSDRGSFSINTSTPPPTTLPADLNNDNIVNIHDAVILSNSFGKKPGETGYNEKADINNDGVVNISDALILSNSFKS